MTVEDRERLVRVKYRQRQEVKMHIADEEDDKNWLITCLEAEAAEVERLKLEHDYEETALDDDRKAAESLAARERERADELAEAGAENIKTMLYLREKAEDQTRIAAEERAQRMMAEDRVKALEGCVRDAKEMLIGEYGEVCSAPAGMICTHESCRLILRIDALLTPAPSEPVMVEYRDGAVERISAPPAEAKEEKR